MWLVALLGGVVAATVSAFLVDAAGGSTLVRALTFGLLLNLGVLAAVRLLLRTRSRTDEPA